VATNSERGIRRVITGTVTSAKADKTVTVEVRLRSRDKHFHKFINRRVKYYAHDENNSCAIGDVVECVEARPYSKMKRWRVTRTLEKGMGELR
jgi:small subunit ribosomal protein S17